MNIQGAFKDDLPEKESRRFSHEHVGDLYQADVLYGPYIKINGKKALDDGMRQIKDRGCAKKYADSGKTIYQVVFAFLGRDEIEMITEKLI